MLKQGISFYVDDHVFTGIGLATNFLTWVFHNNKYTRNLLKQIHKYCYINDFTLKLL